MDAHRNRMLVVEDDQPTCRLLKAYFIRKGWDVTVASTVSDGLARLSPPPDLLVLDLNLPDGFGTRILRQVRMEGLPTRVAVTTAHDPANLGAVTALRPDSLMQKPIDLTLMCQECGF
jgi:DNA-binding response OmpR family regulator